MHLPESSLPCRGFGHARRDLGARMRSFVREVAEHEDETVAERLTQSYHHLPEAPAVGAKKIAIRDDAHGVRHASAAHVVSIRIDRTLQSQGIADSGRTVFRHRSFGGTYHPPLSRGTSIRQAFVLL